MDELLKFRVLPVATIDRVEDALPLARSLRAGGLNIIEITLRTAVALEAVKLIATNFPDMTVGAGTILELAQVQLAKNAGARFGVSPGLNEAVVKKAQELNLPFIPGVMTPSDVEHALSLGCKVLKFFPADVAGGVNMLKALAGPYGHTGIKFIPLGGVTAENASAYLALPIVAAIGGSWLVDRKFLSAKDWDSITTLTRQAMAMAEDRSGRFGH